MITTQKPQFQWEIVNIKLDLVFPNHGKEDHDPIEAENLDEAILIITTTNHPDGRSRLYLNDHVLYKLEAGEFELRVTEFKPSTTRPREEHLAWCKERALEYADKGEFSQALASLMSDLGKHPETKDSAGFCGTFGLPLLQSGDLKSIPVMREFILGFD